MKYMLSVLDLTRESDFIWVGAPPVDAEMIEKEGKSPSPISLWTDPPDGSPNLSSLQGIEGEKL